MAAAPQACKRQKSPCELASGPATPPHAWENQHKTERSGGKVADNELIELSESGQCEQIGISYWEYRHAACQKAHC
jgi:hypothetical protein